jgi:uncharacterized protein (TIRG00374 family)
MTESETSTSFFDRSSRRWWSIGGSVIGLSALAWILWRIDYGRMQRVLQEADLAFLALVPLAIAAEQLVRAWKWRQLVFSIRAIDTLRLFGAIMAGYLANMLVPLGISPIVRSWLVARLEGLKMSVVLATAAIDRFVDGLVFVVFVALALSFAAFPDPNDSIRFGLVVGGVINLVLFSGLLFALSRYKRDAQNEQGWVMRLLSRLPVRFASPSKNFVRYFADGVVWPKERWRSWGIVLASLLMKVIAAAHFLWAGLAFGVLLKPVDYLFLLVFLGFLIILTRFARIPGGFFLGSVFALDLLGVAKEQALAMTLVVQLSTTVTVAGIGAFALWRNGIAIAELRTNAQSASGS